MKIKSLLLQGAFMLIGVSSYASGDIVNAADPNLKTFISNTKWKPDAAYQAQLANAETWTNFLEQHQGSLPAGVIEQRREGGALFGQAPLQGPRRE